MGTLILAALLFAILIGGLVAVILPLGIAAMLVDKEILSDSDTLTCIAFISSLMSLCLYIAILSRLVGS